MFIFRFIGLHIVTQLLLLLLWWKAGRFIIALHAIYVFSPVLFFYYGLSLAALWLLVWGWLRAYVLLADTGRKSRRAAATRGFPLE